MAPATTDMARYWTNPVYKQLVRAVIADPHDDAPRYGIADWLMEQDDNNAQLRAEFIAKSLKHDRGAKDMANLKVIAPEVKWPDGSYVVWVDGRRTVWSTRLLGRIIDIASIHFRHGFVYRIGINLGDFLPIARQLGRSQPLKDLSILGKHPALVRQRSTGILHTCWYRNEGPERQQLPECIWKRLEPTMFVGNRALYEEEHTTDRDAYHNLVEACLDYARS